MNNNYLADIELSYSTFGEKYFIARYQSPVVPRVGEIILLRVHPGYYAAPGEEKPREHIGRFLVHDVIYVACNINRREDWYEPHSPNIVSNDVIINVTPTDDEARAYVNRLAGIEEEPEG
jgi:hypothetical protein